MVSLPGPKLDNVLSSAVREISLLVHVLSVVEAECHQFVSHSDGEVRDYQRLHEAIRGHLASVGFGEPRHYVIGHQAGYSLRHAIF